MEYILKIGLLLFILSFAFARICVALDVSPAEKIKEVISTAIIIGFAMIVCYFAYFVITF